MMRPTSWPGWPRDEKGSQMQPSLPVFSHKGTLHLELT